MNLKDFKHTIESCILCMQFPFLYPRNRWSGRHRVSALAKLRGSLLNSSTISFSVTGQIEEEDKRCPYHNKIGKLKFLNTSITLDKDNNKLIISNNVDTKECDLSHVTWSDNRFEIVGLDLSFSFGGNPIVKVLASLKDKNDTTNYGFAHRSVELITNPWKYRLYKAVKWFDEEVLDRLLFIPTYTELDAMPEGWRKAFGIQMCKDIKAQLKKEHYLYKYRIMQIKEKFGRLCWYDAYSSNEILNIIMKYEELSWNTCVMCGKPATVISSGWICPYCDDCYDKQYKGGNIPYMTKSNGKWEESDEYKEAMRKLDEKYKSMDNSKTCKPKKKTTKKKTTNKKHTK